MTYLANSLMSQLKSGVLTVIPYQLDIFIVKVGQADNVMDNDLVMGKGFWKPHGYTGKGTTGKGQGLPLVYATDFSFIQIYFYYYYCYIIYIYGQHQQPYLLMRC